MKFGQSVAIVGVGGVFPKSPTLDCFWEIISNNLSAAGHPPNGRWLIDPADAFDQGVGSADKVYSKSGCFIEDGNRFPPSPNLDIDPAFLSQLDPSIHLLLQAGQQAFEDAQTELIDRQRTGVIIGNLALPSESSSAFSRDLIGRTFVEKLIGHDEWEHKKVAPINSYVAGFPAGLLAKALGLSGTCYTLDAACASSLYAISLAVDELLSGRADAMLTGGLSRPDPLYTQMGFSQLHALSPTGTCSPFDRNGDGLVVGEGSGMFLLKRTEDAVRGNNQIYAVIRGIGLSNDLGGSLLAPASEGQIRAMRSAYQQAGWAPTDIDLIECHATGTPVGDLVEYSSLKSLWGNKGWRAGQCVIGSVKSNIGHLLTAAGSAALIKVLLAIKERTLPPSANFNEPAKGIDLEESPFRILKQPKPWKQRRKGHPRRAAISAFGFGGINAHLLVEEWIPQPPTKSQVAYHPSFRKKTQPIAIVGVGAHFGPWESVNDLCPRLLGGEPDIKPVVPSRWWGVEQSDWYQNSPFNKIDFKGHFVSTAKMPTGKFRIPPKEVEEMLPRQLLMLNVADQALQDAGLKKEDLLFTGVFIGAGLDLNATNFSFRWCVQKYARVWAQLLGLDLTEKQFEDWVKDLRDASGPALSANRVMGALGSIVASRVAKEFRVGGPSFTLCSEDNSGLRALEVGVRALQEGAINRAIIGAVDMAGDLRSVLSQHEIYPFSSLGETRPFDKEADGSVIGEGAAAVVLKRLDDAQQDGDRIYAVVKGVGTATGGWVESCNPDEQTYQLSLERAFAEAAVKASSISYLETHGSGVPTHDELEAEILGSYVGAENSEVPCYIGSAKADVGHAGAAAGLASLIKAMLCLDQKILPPLRGTRGLRYEWVRGNRQFIAPKASQYWMRNKSDGPRRALIAGLGVDGTCSHVVLEGIEGKHDETTSGSIARPLGPLQEGLFAVEADNTKELLDKISLLKDFVALAPDGHIEDLAIRWLRQGGIKTKGKHCLAAVSSNRSELLEQLDYAQETLQSNPKRTLGNSGSSQVRDRVFYSPEPLAYQGKVMFVFPGSGNHFAGMGRELSARWPAIYTRQDQRSQFLARQYLPEHFWQEDLDENLDHNHNALVIGQVAIGTALSDLVRSFGIEAHAVCGYSLGESAGLFSFDVWQDRDGMSQRLRESSLFTDDLAGTCRAAKQVWGLKKDEKIDWVIGIVDAPAEKVRQALRDRDRAYLLIINTYNECVIGGDRQQISEVAHAANGHFFPLRGVTTVHCEVVRPVAKAYRDLHLFPVTTPDQTMFYSCALGTKYQVTTDSAADVILDQALDTIDYTAVIEQAYSDGHRIFLEMGPGNSCSRMINSILEGRSHMARSASFSGQQPVSQLLRFLAHCLAEGVALNWSALYPDTIPLIEKGPDQWIASTIGGVPFLLPIAPKEAPSKSSENNREESVMNDSEHKVDGTPPEVLPSRSSPERTLAEQIVTTATLNAKTHQAYLNFAKTMETTLSENISLQMSLLQKIAGQNQPLPGIPHFPQTEHNNMDEPPLQSVVQNATEGSFASNQELNDLVEEPVLNREMCMEFAIGSIANVLGQEFAEVDTYPTRVRLPDEPLMLVDRIIAVEGEPRSMTEGRVITEHDVTEDRWYLDGGHIPTCIAVEAGQADLFLSGYLGIDFIAKGKAVYRLLDAVVAFHRGLPEPGDVIRYDIKIDHFFRQDKTYLFRFNFEGTVNGEPLLSMENGCAGFFTAEELAAGQGIVHTEFDLKPQRGKRPDDWHVLTPLQKESFDDVAVAAIYEGALGRAFGSPFIGLPLNNPYTLPGGKLKLVDRVVDLDPHGGRYGLGQIRAEMDIHPEDWFLTCHFCDDHVMPGTLMYECCMHTLRIYLIRMGWIGEQGTTWCEPVPGINSGLKCRGQVIETTKKVTYQVSLKELGYGPEPFAIADALMFADGKPIVEISNMSIRLTGLTRKSVEDLWLQPEKLISPQSPVTNAKRPVYDYEAILAFSTGNPSEAFGEPYRIFDHERKIARLPRPPFQFLDRIVEVNGEPFKLEEGATCVAEYDIPPSAWYFQAGGQPEMPFSVLLEVGLQPCGWLAAYLGSALTSQIDLKFRNLDGNASQHRSVTPDSGTLSTQIKISRIAKSAGMIIQSFDFQISDAVGPVYSGDTVFGFFSEAALGEQVGVRDAVRYHPTETDLLHGEHFPYPESKPFPTSKLRMIDKIDLFVHNGGPSGLGFIRGIKRIDPAEWYFEAHFYQDPVCPGSLGLESFLQLLKVAAARRWPVNEQTVFQTVALGEPHSWNYRGQIVPSNDQVQVEAVIKAVDDVNKLLHADGWLSVDGKVIYQMKNFSVKVSS